MGHNVNEVYLIGDVIHQQLQRDVSKNILFVEFTAYVADLVH